MNSELADSQRLLDDDAVVAQANADGEISVRVTKSGGTTSDDALISAVAIQEVGPGTAGFNVVQSGSSTTVSESGTQDSVSITLKSQPTGTVVINVAGNDPTELSISPTALDV